MRRLEQARAFLDVAISKPMRVLPLRVGGGPKVVITTDASPEGLGGVLSLNGVFLQAFKSEVTKEDADRHSFTRSRGVAIYPLRLSLRAMFP